MLKDLIAESAKQFEELFVATGADIEGMKRVEYRQLREHQVEQVKAHHLAQISSAFALGEESGKNCVNCKRIEAKAFEAGEQSGIKKAVEAERERIFLELSVASLSWVCDECNGLGCAGCGGIGRPSNGSLPEKIAAIIKPKNE